MAKELLATISALGVTFFFETVIVKRQSVKPKIYCLPICDDTGPDSAPDHSLKESGSPNLDEYSEIATVPEESTGRLEMEENGAATWDAVGNDFISMRRVVKEMEEKKKEEEGQKMKTKSDYNDEGKIPALVLCVFCPPLALLYHNRKCDSHLLLSVVLLIFTGIGSHIYVLWFIFRRKFASLPSHEE